MDFIFAPWLWVPITASVLAILLSVYGFIRWCHRVGHQVNETQKNLSEFRQETRDGHKEWREEMRENNKRIDKRIEETNKRFDQVLGLLAEGKLRDKQQD